jgi:hypothetical protein
MMSSEITLSLKQEGHPTKKVAALLDCITFRSQLDDFCDCLEKSNQEYCALHLRKEADKHFRSAFAHPQPSSVHEHAGEAFAYSCILRTNFCISGSFCVEEESIRQLLQKKHSKLPLLVLPENNCFRALFNGSYLTCDLFKSPQSETLYRRNKNTGSV